MPKLKRVSGKQAVRSFERIGFNIVRQRGSHIVLRLGGRGCVIPNHKELAIGTLRGILKQARVTPDEFISNL